MSHLGIVSSIVAASNGFNVFCYDLDHRKIENLKNHKIEINEPDLIRLLKQAKSKITFFNDFSSLKKKIDCYMVSQDVKTFDNGVSDLTDVKNLLKIIKKVALDTSAVVILSQVPPKFTRKYQKNFLYLYYQVETLIFGNAIKRAKYPERMIIGVNTKEEQVLHTKYHQYLKSFKCPLIMMNYESAELAKLSINLFLISSITFGNLMDKISSNIGANWEDISRALRLDKRIGIYSYIQPGLGLSGGNLERDLKNITNYTDKNSLEDDYFNNQVKINSEKKIFPIKRYSIFKKTSKKTNVISILGVVYKDNTDSFKNSPTINLLKYLQEENDIYVYDKHVKKITGISNVTFTNSLKSALNFPDVIFIMSPLKEFNKLNTLYENILIRSKLIIDPFKVITSKKILIKKNYFYN